MSMVSVDYVKRMFWYNPMQGAYRSVLTSYAFSMCFSQFTGPFLHLFGIVTLTALSWYVAGGLGTLKKRGEYIIMKHSYNT